MKSRDYTTSRYMQVRVESTPLQGICRYTCAHLHASEFNTAHLGGTLAQDGFQSLVNMCFVLLL
jgi:hypothetical protein